MTQATNGYQKGDSFNLVTPPPTYEGELAPGEQANAEFVDQLEGEELLDDLQDGGYVIYFRHAQTERDFADQVTADVNDYSTQRVLSEFGVQQSLAISEGFEISQIPYDDVITSEYGRAVTTAAIAFGEYEKDSALNFLPFEDYTDEQVEEMKANVTPFLTAVPEAGTNSIIVGHDDLFEAGSGIYPDPQGIAYLLKPDRSGDFEIIANLLPEEWVELSGDAESGEGTPVDNNNTGSIPNQGGEGWNPGDSFNLVTPPPTYEGELAPGEQANAEFVDQLEGEELLDELQDGGYVIYFRHAQTERDFADQITADVNDYSTQRVLSEFGVKQSLAIAEGFEISDIPIASVITSEYGRAVTTAAIAFGEYQKDSALNFLPFEDYTDEQVEEMKANVTPFLTAVPEEGTNNIIVGHDDLFEAGSGIYPDPQGIAYILEPDGNGDFEIVANLLPEEWVELVEDTPNPGDLTIVNYEFSWTGQIAGFSVEGEFSYDAAQSYEAGIVREEDLLSFDISFFDPDGNLLRTYTDNQDLSKYPTFNFAFDTKTEEILQDGTWDVDDDVNLSRNGFMFGEGNPDLRGVEGAQSGLAFWTRPSDDKLPHLHVDDWDDELGFPIGYSTHEDVSFPTLTVADLIDNGKVGETYLESVQDNLDELGKPVVVELTIDDSFMPVFGTLEGDVIEVEGSNQLIFAGDMNDLIDASISSGGGNRIYAGSGEDTVILGSSDRIIGGDGDDKFFAMSGGDNVITGGEGADQFWIATAEIPEATNIITDFTSAEDVLGIAGLGISFEDLSITQHEDNTLIAANGSDLAILQGIGADSLIVDNFAFV